MPHFDGQNPGHVVARADAFAFDDASVAFLDLWDWDASLAGYFGGFGYVTTGPTAEAGVMRRISMAVLKATARHTLHGLEMIVPQAMHTHAER